MYPRSSLATTLARNLRIMGFLRLLNPHRERLADGAVERAYIAGLDCVPTGARKVWESEHLLRLERDNHESGNVYIPWQVEGHGELLLCTATLMERDRPYHLPVELARGSVNRLRSKAEAWKLAGLRVSETLAAEIQAASRTFIQAATAQHDDLAAATAAEDAIRQSLDAMDRLGSEYAQQALQYRHEAAGPLPTLLAGSLGREMMPANTEPMFRAAFNAVVVPCSWREVQPEPDRWEWGQCDKQVQWCYRHGLKVIGGPLLPLDRARLPEWVTAANSDLAGLAKTIRKFVEAAVERYRNQVHLWHIVSETAADPWLADDQKLRLSAMVIEAARRRDPRTPVFLSVDQPWGEPLAFQRAQLPPLQFVDFLLRADVEIAGIGLEINYGYWPTGSLPRDVLEVTEHVDLWAMLGLPLILMFTIPSSLEADHLASDGSVVPSSAFPQGLSPQDQKKMVDRFFPALLAKQPVQALVWNEVFDSLPHRYAHGGLFNAQALPKPALSSLLALRREHLT